MTPAEIKTIRQQLGLTQAGLARVMGLSREHINRLESGVEEIGDQTNRLLRAYADGYRPADWPA